MGLEKEGENFEKKKKDWTTFSRGQKDQSSGWQKKWRHEKIFLRWEGEIALY